MTSGGSNKLAVVILTLNEQKHIAACIEAIPEGFPTVLVDSGSTDDTVQIAKDLGAEVLHRPWTGFADQRNFAMAELRDRFDWLLFVDADERFAPEFFTWANEFFEKPTAEVVYVSQRMVLNETMLRHAPHYPIWHPRLVKTERPLFVVNASGHGETVLADAAVEQVDIPYLHHFVDADVQPWLIKHVHLAEKESAPDLSAPGRVTARARLGRLMGPGPLRAVARFLFHYVWCRGFLDGRAGFQYSLMYFWYEITKWVFRNHRKMGQSPLNLNVKWR